MLVSGVAVPCGLVGTVDTNISEKLIVFILQADFGVATLFGITNQNTNINMLEMFPLDIILH
jgi:hypothetical protein